MNKMGRNDLCLCGSGKKYKKCHLNMSNIPILQKVSDRGSNDDFIARILFGMLEIRDHIYHEPKEIKDFDDFYTPIYQNLLEAEYSKNKAKELLEKHVQNIESGIKSEIKENQININENIDLELNLFFKDFFIRGGIALSYLVKFADYLGYNITFIYQKDKDFEIGIKKYLEKNQSPLMEFLVNKVRSERENWYSSFRKTRNDIEHDGWSLPNIRYTFKDGKILIIIPQFNTDLSLDKGLDFLWERLMEFCEEMVVMLISTKLRPELVIMQIPKEKRDPEQPVRFKVILSPDIMNKM